MCLGRVWSASARDPYGNGGHWWENLCVEAEVRVGQRVLGGPAEGRYLTARLGMYQVPWLSVYPTFPATLMSPHFLSISQLPSASPFTPLGHLLLLVSHLKTVPKGIWNSPWHSTSPILTPISSHGRPLLQHHFTFSRS